MPRMSPTRRLWVPVSLVPQPDGSTLPFPHFYERGKPGYITVDATGQRFTNDSASYHDFVPDMVEACRSLDETSCWLACDYRAIRRCGMGAIGPAPLPLGPHLKSGNLLVAPDWAELAAKMGVSAEALQSTIERFNTNAARRGPGFRQGTDAYHRFNGDPTHGPNACLAPLVRGPFYAMKLIPADIGTFLGLRVDGHARVLDRSGSPHYGPLCRRQRHDQRHGRYLSRGRYHHWPGPHLRLYRGPTRGLGRPLTPFANG